MHIDTNLTGFSGCPTGILLCVINYVDVCTETNDSCTRIIAVVFNLSQTRLLPPAIWSEKETKSKQNKSKVTLLRKNVFLHRPTYMHFSIKKRG